eukprot:g79557.t1
MINSSNIFTFNQKLNCCITDARSATKTLTLNTAGGPHRQFVPYNQMLKGLQSWLLNLISSLSATAKTREPMGPEPS